MKKGMMILKVIDFKQGIMAKPINDNFQEVDKAIRQERLNVGGYGVSYGLDATIDKLSIHFKAGHVIDKEGYSYDIAETTLTCDPPQTEFYTEKCDVMYDGMIFLKYAPYALNGQSETDLKEIHVSMDGVAIDTLFIEKNAIRISKDYAYKKVEVTYRYTLPRIDSIIVEKNKLSIIKGIPSQSPSVRPQDRGFCICCVLVDPYGSREDTLFYAQLAKVHEQDHLRNVYTNSDNELFLNGIKISDLGFIYFERPENPKPNMIWYDKYTHRLYVYLSHEWVAIGDHSSTPFSEFKIFTPETCPADLRTFIFHKEEDMNVRFMSGNNELRVMIDQYPLFRDQFEEITYKKALTIPEIRDVLPLYGYSLNENFNATYENMGIGFRLHTALTKPCYVEAETVHRVVDANLHSRHQRSASFIKTGYIDLEAFETEFETHVPYRYNENQLQLMTADKNLFEHFDYEEVGTEQSELTRKVVLSRAFGYKQRIHYRITTNVYSYDHVSQLIEEAAEHILESNEPSRSTKKKTEKRKNK